LWKEESGNKRRERALKLASQRWRDGKQKQFRRPAQRPAAAAVAAVRKKKRRRRRHFTLSQRHPTPTAASQPLRRKEGRKERGEEGRSRRR
jgi:hypothetical protein